MKKLLALAALLACRAAHAEAPAPTRCDVHSPRYDRSEIRCDLGNSTTAQRLRFQAHFSGSHDDTRATLSATIDGQAVVCEPGSKLLSESEDGEGGLVTLACRFTAAARASTLRVQLVWHHARYERFSLQAE